LHSSVISTNNCTTRKSCIIDEYNLLVIEKIHQEFESTNDKKIVDKMVVDKFYQRITKFVGT